MADDQRQLPDATFAALLGAKCAGVSLSKINELVARAYDLNDVPAGPLSPNATDDEINERVRVLGLWGASL